MGSALSFALSLQQRLQVIADANVNWKAGVMGVSTGVYLLETYLTLRQYPMYSKKSPPDALAHKFEPEVFEKSQLYGRDKARFSLVSSAFSQVLELGMLYFDVTPWVWGVAGNILAKYGYAGYEIPHSLLFIGIFMALSAIPSLPISYYQTFVLEQKHGFNKSTVGLFIADTLKSWALVAVLGSPFMAGFLWIIRWAGSSFIPYLMSFLVSFQLLMVVLYPLVIQPLFNKLSPLPKNALRTRIEALATRLNFPLTDLYVIDGSKRSAHSNAYFYGLPWSKHIVIYDTLIKQSSPEEIEAVLAHELGHWSYSHPLKMLVVSQIHLLLILSAFPPFLKSQALAKSFGFPSSVYKPQPPVLVAFMLFQMVLTPFEAVFSLGMNALSREFEWQADRFALELGESALASDVVVKKDEEEVEGEDEKRVVYKPTGAVDDLGTRLAAALITLHVENLSTVWVDWLYSAYHYSHPTLAERLKAMDDWRDKQAKKTQ